MTYFYTIAQNRSNILRVYQYLLHCYAYDLNISLPLKNHNHCKVRNHNIHHQRHFNLALQHLQCTTDISKHTTDHRKTDNHQKNQNHMQEHPCNSSNSSAIGNQTIATLAKKKTLDVPITACSILNARPLTPPLPPSPPSSTFDTTSNIDTFAKTDNSPSSFSSKNNKTSHNTE